MEWGSLVGLLPSILEALCPNPQNKKSISREGRREGHKMKCEREGKEKEGGRLAGLS